MSNGPQTIDPIPGLVGPGSQPGESDGKTLDYMEMPRDMMTFELPTVPEPEDTVGLEAGKAKLEEIYKAALSQKIDAPTTVVDLADLKGQDLGLINQILGEGEVAMVGGERLQVQESVFAGVWRVLHFDNGKMVRDTVEIGAWPSAVQSYVFADASKTAPKADATIPEMVHTAPTLLMEVEEKLADYKPGDQTHTINLSLLPHTEEDLVYLDEKLGKGDTIILSRGYGNCRVSSTKTHNVWWVRFYNSQDAIILNSIEIIDVPGVVCAAPEDIEDSAERIGEILELYKNGE